MQNSCRNSDGFRFLLSFYINANWTPKMMNSAVVYAVKLYRNAKKRSIWADIDADSVRLSGLTLNKKHPLLTAPHGSPVFSDGLAGCSFYSRATPSNEHAAIPPPENTQYAIVKTCHVKKGTR